MRKARAKVHGARAARSFAPRCATKSARSAAASHKPPMLATRVRLRACALLAAVWRGLPPGLLPGWLLAMPRDRAVLPLGRQPRPHTHCTSKRCAIHKRAHGLGHLGQAARAGNSAGHALRSPCCKGRDNATCRKIRELPREPEEYSVSQGRGGGGTLAKRSCAL